MGGGSSSTTTVRKRDPESPELKNLQTGIYNLLAPIIGIDTTGSNVANAASVKNLQEYNGHPLKTDTQGRYYYETDDTRWIERPEDNRWVTDTRRNYLTDDQVKSLKSSQNNLIPGTNDAWANSYFGRSWLDLRDRIDAANAAYDQALAAASGLQGNVLNTAGQIADLSKTAQSALQPNINNINNASAAINALAGQVAGLGDAEARALQPNIDAITKQAGLLSNLAESGQTALQPNINRINQNAGLITGIGNQLAALAPEAQAALQPNIRNMNDVSGKLAGLGDTINSAASGYANESGNLNKKIEGVGDRQGDLASTIWRFTETGNIPEEMKRNLMDTVNSELRTNTGSTLNDLAARGVMNSTVANRSINNLSNAAADAYAKNYMDAYNAVLGGYGQTNNTLASQADTYAKVRAGLDTGWNNQLAGYDAARNAWNSALGGYEGANNQITQGFNNRMNALNNAGQQYQNAIGGYNTANQNITQGFNNRMGAINNAVNAYNTANANIRNSYADRQNALNSASAQHQNAISGWNTANNNISQGYNNRLNGLNAAMSGYQQAYNNNASQMQNMAAMPQTLAKSAFAQYEPVYNYWQALRNSYDSKEDYDTVVKQGK